MQKDKPNWPVRILGAASGLFGQGFLEDLSSVDLLLHRAAGDETIDDHWPCLTDAVCPIHSLAVCRWVPAGINCRDLKRSRKNIFKILKMMKSVGTPSCLSPLPHHYPLPHPSHHHHHHNLHVFHIPLPTHTHKNVQTISTHWWPPCLHRSASDRPLPPGLWGGTHYRNNLFGNGWFYPLYHSSFWWYHQASSVWIPVGESCNVAK